MPCSQGSPEIIEECKKCSMNLSYTQNSFMVIAATGMMY